MMLLIEISPPCLKNHRRLGSIKLPHYALSEQGVQTNASEFGRCQACKQSINPRNLAQAFKHLAACKGFEKISTTHFSEDQLQSENEI
jgi:acetyl-CoA carboxylase beta subunit